MTLGSLWNYYRSEIDGADDNALQSKSFVSKTKIVENHQKDHHYWYFYQQI